jgi:hypothetical protein
LEEASFEEFLREGRQEGKEMPPTQGRGARPTCKVLCSLCSLVTEGRAWHTLGVIRRNEPMEGMMEEGDRNVSSLGFFGNSVDLSGVA